MPATFHLCATDHSSTRVGQRLLAELAAPLGRKFRACHVGVFHGDDRGWTKKSVDFLASLGADCAAPRLSDKKVDVAAARDAIEGADLLYLDGGDTVAGVDRIRELGLETAFEHAARTARVIFGLSGGACSTGPCTIGYRGDEPYVARCLDLGVPLPIDVHDERHDWPEIRALLALKSAPKEVVAIPTGAILRVSPRGTLASVGATPCERRRVARDGSFSVREIAAPRGAASRSRPPSR